MTTTDVLGWIVPTSGNPVFLFIDGETDGTALAEIKQESPAKSVGEVMKGRSARKIGLQASDGSVVDEIQMKNGAGLVASFYGKERSIGDGVFNFLLDGIVMPISDDYTLELDTAD